MPTPAATEQVLFTLRTHPKVLFQPLVVQVALIVAHIAVYRYFPAATGYAWIDEWGQLSAHGIIAFIELTVVLIPALKWWNSSFTATDRRLIETWGVLYRHTREIRMDRIASVTTERGILDRIFGAGTLVFHDAAMVDLATPQPRGLAQRSGEGKLGVRFHDIPRVKAVRAVIEEAREAATR